MLPLPRLPAQSVGDANAYPVEAGQRSAIHFTLAGIEHQSLQPAQSRFEPVTSGWKAAASQASNHYVLTQPIIHKQSLGAQLKIRELNLFFASPQSLAHRAPQPKWSACSISAPGNPAGELQDLPTDTADSTKHLRWGKFLLTALTQQAEN